MRSKDVTFNWEYYDEEHDREITFQIDYTAHPYVPAYTPRGEYAPVDPPEPAFAELNEYNAVHFVQYGQWHNEMKVVGFQKETNLKTGAVITNDDVTPDKVIPLKDCAAIVEKLNKLVTDEMIQQAIENHFEGLDNEPDEPDYEED